MPNPATIDRSILEAPDTQGQMVHGGGGNPPLNKAEVRKFKQLARMIRNDVHLQAILNTVPFDQRETMYDQFVPWLTFKAAPFSELRFF